MAFKTNPLAQQLNERLEQAAPDVLAMLSPLGRRLYFPKGILSQSAEAKQKAHALQRHDRHRDREGRPDVPAVDAAPPRRHRARRRLQLRAAGGPPDAARALAREAARREPVAARQGVRSADRDERAHARTRRRRAISSSTRATASCCPTSSGGTTGSPTRCGSAREIVDLPVLRGRRLPHRGVRAGARRERAGARQADRAAQLPEQPDRLHADAGRRRGDRRRAARRRPRSGTKIVVDHRRRVLRALLPPRRRVDDGVALRPARGPPPEPARGEARRRHQGALRLGPALRLHHLRPRRSPRAPRWCARCSTRRRAARSAARSRTARSSRRRWSRRRSTTSSIADERKAEGRDAARARGEGLRGGERGRASARASTPIPSTAATSCA